MNLNIVNHTNGKNYALISFSFLICSLLPILYFSLGIAYDYPNHIARVFIEGNVYSNNFLGKYYYLKFDLIPHSAMDIVLSPIVAWTGLYLSAQIFTIAAVSLLPIGAVLIHRILFDRWSYWPLLSVLAIYNYNLMWGLINCIAALGLALIAFAAWLRFSDRGWWFLAPMFLAVNVVLLFAHAFGLLALGFLVLTWEVGKTSRMPANDRLQYALKRGAIAPSFIFPLATLLWTIGDLDKMPNLVPNESWAYLIQTFLAANDFGPGMEGEILVGILGGLLYFAVSRRALIVHPEMRFTLICFALLVLVIPPSLFNVTYLHIRLPPVLFCLFFAGTAFRTTNRECLVVVTALSVAAVGVSQFAAWRTMYKNDALQSELATSFQRIEPGQRLIAAWGLADANRNFPSLHRNFPYVHGISLAVIEASSYVPNLFTGSSIVKIKPGFRHMHLHGAFPLTPERLSEAVGRKANVDENMEIGNRSFYYGWESNFDYLLWLDASEEYLPRFSFLTEVTRGSFFILYKIAHS